jgi:hypothetical protein
MGYLIRMAPEVQQWLAAVRDRDPAAAALIDEAVAALRAGGESAGPPLVVPLDDDPSLNARPDLDTAYERQLEKLTRVRRAVADVATSRKRLELQANQLELQIGKLGEHSRTAMEAGRGDLAEEAGARQGTAREQLADLQRQYARFQFLVRDRAGQFTEAFDAVLSGWSPAKPRRRRSRATTQFGTLHATTSRLRGDIPAGERPGPFIDRLGGLSCPGVRAVAFPLGRYRRPAPCRRGAQARVPEVHRPCGREEDDKHSDRRH